MTHSDGVFKGKEAQPRCLENLLSNDCGFAIILKKFGVRNVRCLFPLREKRKKGRLGRTEGGESCRESDHLQRGRLKAKG